MPGSGDRIGDDVRAEKVVPGAEKDVENEELRDDIDDIEELGRRVESNEIVAVPVADAEAAQAAWQEVAYACAAADPVAVLIFEVVVEVANHVLDRLLTPLRVECVLDRLGRLDEVVDVDARPVVEHAPEEARQVEEERLEKVELDKEYNYMKTGGRLFGWQMYCFSHVLMKLKRWRQWIVRYGWESIIWEQFVIVTGNNDLVLPPINRRSTIYIIGHVTGIAVNRCPPTTPYNCQVVLFVDIRRSKIVEDPKWQVGLAAADGLDRLKVLVVDTFRRWAQQQ